MKAHLPNAAYGILDYTAFPLGTQLRRFSFGMQGIAMARLGFSKVQITLHIPLFRRLFAARPESATVAIFNQVREER